MLDVVVTSLVVIAIALGALVTLVLTMPIHLSAAGCFDDEEQCARAAVKWAWGLVGLKWSTRAGAGVYLFGVRVARLTGGDEADRKRRKRRKRERKADKKRAVKRAGKGSKGVGWLREHARTLLGLVGKGMRALHIRGRIWLRVGLDDPADTALVTHGLALLNPALGGVDLWIEADYLEDNLQVDGWLGARVWPIQFVGIALGSFLFDRQTRAMVWPSRA